MTSIAFIIDFITYFSVFCFVFHLKLKKSVLHISLGCAWAVLGSCFLYLYSPDFSYRIIILFGLYLLFQAKLDHVLVCFSLYTLISYLAECYGLYFYSLLTGTNVLDNPLILSLCRIFVSLFFLLLCIPFYRGTVTIFPFSRLSAKKNLFISGLCFLHLGLMGILNAFFNYDMSTVGRRLMVILTLILLLMFSTIFYLYLKLKKSKEKLEEKSRLQQYQWELEKQHYLDLQKKDQALRKFRHDYKHHILAMQELAARKDYGELLTYLNDLSHIQSQTASISTNNPVADAIFNYFDSIKPAHTEFCVDGRFQPFMPPFFEIPSGRIVSLWILRYFPLHRCESEILRKNKRWKALPHYKGIPFHQSSLFTFVHSKLPGLHCRGLSAHLHIGSIIHIIKVESEHLVEVFPVSLNIS